MMSPGFSLPTLVGRFPSPKPQPGADAGRPSVGPCPSPLLVADPGKPGGPSPQTIREGIAPDDKAATTSTPGALVSR